MKFDAGLITQKRKELPFKVKTAGIQYKELDESERIVKLVANTLNFFDYDFDALAPGCANRSISDNGAKSNAHDKIQHLLMHDMCRPVGKSKLESEEEVDGKKVLYVESFLPETTEGEDTLIKYKAGIHNQHSIGFRYMNLEYLEKGAIGWDKWMAELINPEDADEVGFGWRISEIKWWEYSTVTFGANKLTPYLGAKSGNKIDNLEIINQKIAILANKAMRKEIKNKKAFDFELAQLQAMVLELSDNEDSLKDRARQDSRDKGAQDGKILTGFSKHLKINY